MNKKVGFLSNWQPRKKPFSDVLFDKITLLMTIGTPVKILITNLLLIGAGFLYR
jgi:hypothetical protein